MLHTFILLPSIFFFVSSHLLLPSLSSFFFSPPLTRPHKAEEWQLLPISAEIDLFWWSFQPELAISACFGGRFGHIGSRFHPNQPVLARISANMAESARIDTQKKKRGVSESNAASDSGVATLEPHRCFLAHYQKRYLFLKISIHVPEQSCIFPVE